MNQPTPAPHPATTDLARDERIWFGASWYPELWPEPEWDRDLAQMRELGFNLVRSFEFAWALMEPTEGNFDFSWLLRAMDKCHQSGIAVCVGTPTAAPPIWVSERFPEVLSTHHDGRRAAHGARHHASRYHPKYRELCLRITTKLAEAVTGHPALQSWQIDNELCGFDYGPATKQQFHAWLTQRYGTAQALNARWNLNFWSQAYERIEQMPMPVAEVGSTEVPERGHPSLVMAVARAQNAFMGRFISEQADAIRAVAAARGVPVKPISTNMVASIQMSWFDHNRHLDRVGHSMYSDLDHYHLNLWKYDRMRAEKHAPDGSRAPFWMLETAPSWSAGGRIWNIHHDGGGIRLMTWLGMALGGSMMCYWQWREHWGGQEMQHGTLVTATGQWRPNKAAIADLGKQFAQHGTWLLANPPPKAGIGIFLSNENAWGFSIDPIDDCHKGYMSLFMDEVHLRLAQAHWWRDVISERHDLAPYRLLIVPFMPFIDADLRQRLTDWVRAGGRLLLGPCAGYRSEDWTAFTDKTFGGLESLIGADSEIRFPVKWVEGRKRVVFTDGSHCRTKLWCEGFTPTTGTALAHYRSDDERDGYGDGSAAIIHHRVGKGEVITLGCPIEEPAWMALVERLARAAGLTPEATGDAGVTVVPRVDAAGRRAGWAVVNRKETPQRVTLPGGGTDLLSGERCGPVVDLAPVQVRLIAAG